MCVCVLYKCNLHPYLDNCATNNPGYVSSLKNVLCLVSGQPRRVTAAEGDKCLAVTMTHLFPGKTGGWRYFLSDYSVKLYMCWHLYLFLKLWMFLLSRYIKYLDLDGPRSTHLRQNWCLACLTFHSAISRSYTEQGSRCVIWRLYSAAGHISTFLLVP